MATQYFCNDEERRELARANGRNGIDFVEVLDRESPTEQHRQRTILVYFLAPLTADIAPSSVVITGGVRIREIAMHWTARDTTLDPTLTAAELAFYGSLGDNVLIVRTDRYGDHSNYVLTIEDQDEARFDPRLLATNFSFKAECPHEFDCAPKIECPPEVATEPLIDYLARDFSGFRRIMLDRLSVLMPGWEDRNQIPDVQVALVEAMAYVGDRLSYSQDAAATEAYLGTAHQRPSLRRHGRLLDYRLHEGVNARTWIHINLNAAGPAVIAPGTQFMSRLTTSTIAILPESAPRPAGEHHPYGEALLQQPAIFEATDNKVAFGSHNAIEFYTWGDELCCLPTGATRATLRDGAAAVDRLRLRVGDVVILEQVRDAVTGLAADADPLARHAVRLTSVIPEADAVLVDGVEVDRTPGPMVRDPLPIGGNPGQAVVEIEWDADDALPFPICISVEIDGDVRDDLAVVLANVTLADHGRTTVLPDPLTVTAGARPYRPQLDVVDLTYAGPSPSALDGLRSASTTTMQDPRQALPAITLDDNGDTWEPLFDLLDSDRFARNFVVEMHNDRTPELRFGDNLKGRTPTADSLLAATARVGSGAKGNVGHDVLVHIATIDASAHAALAPIVADVRNPVAGHGGIDPEPAEHVQLYGPEAFRVQERAVTEADYSEVAERRRDIQKAAGTRRWTGSWHTMFVTVDRFDGDDVDAAFEADLVRYLDRYRLAGQDVEIDGPRFVALNIALAVCVETGYFRSDVKYALLRELSCRPFPNGRLGFFHPDRYTFNDTLYLSDLVARAMSVSGVRSVDVTTFQRWGEESDNELSAAQIEFDRLEIPQLDNDPNAPENGRLNLTMAGGQ